MSHRHFCDFAGHYWDCEATATRLFAPKPSVCMCMGHGVPMEEGDHSECSVELLSCPEHRADQMRAMGHEPGYTIERPPEDAEGSSMFKDAEGNPTIGFCIWCGKDYYTMDDVGVHNADEMANCPMFQELKDEDCGPPVLFQKFEDAGLLGEGEQKPKKRKRSNHKKDGAAKN